MAEPDGETQVFVAYAGLLTIGAVIGAVDLLAGLLLVFAVSAAAGLAGRGVEATGHVVRVDGRRPGRSTRVRVAYETAGGRFEMGASSDRPRLGDPVTVWYDPARPSRASTMTRPGRRIVIGIPVVLAVAAVSAGMITGSVWHFAGVHGSLQAPLAGGSWTLAIALACGYYACSRYAELLRWRRMVRAEGTVLRFDEHAPGGPGILVSFESDGDREEFWARAGSVPAGVGDRVTVHYDPARPARTATVQTPAEL
jgi:hypothetical protein